MRMIVSMTTTMTMMTRMMMYLQMMRGICWIFDSNRFGIVVFFIIKDVCFWFSQPFVKLHGRRNLALSMSMWNPWAKVIKRKLVLFGFYHGFCTSQCSGVGIFQSVCLPFSPMTLNVQCPPLIHFANPGQTMKFYHPSMLFKAALGFAPLVEEEKNPKMTAGPQRVWYLRPQ